MERINTILGVKLLLVWIFAASLLGAQCYCARASYLDSGWRFR